MVSELGAVSFFVMLAVVLVAPVLAGNVDHPTFELFVTQLAIK